MAVQTGLLKDRENVVVVGDFVSSAQRRNGGDQCQGDDRTAKWPMIDRAVFGDAEKICFQTENDTRSVGAIFRDQEKNLRGMSAQVWEITC